MVPGLMRLLVAPDKFRGTLTAGQAAAAIAAGWRRTRPEDEIDQAPMADGGEGTLDAVLATMGGSRRVARVRGPLGDPVEAVFGLIDGPKGRTAVIELARASGLELVTPARRDPLRASTWGTGELILAGCREGAREVLLCIGGSATVDGGAGIAQALGVGLLDATGRDIGPGGIGLLDLTRVDLGGMHAAVRGARIVVACDVDSPLMGPEGAAHVFGPQKGASPPQVLVLERALGHLAAVVHRDLGIDVRSLPGGGAAGGAGAGMAAFLGARLRPGVRVVMEVLDLRRRLREATAVLTGEGAFDRQSGRGKVVGGVLAAAREAGVPAVVLCGRAELVPDGVLVVSLAQRFGLERAMADPRRLVEELASEVAAGADRLSSSPL